jgi:proline racemase
MTLGMREASVPATWCLDSDHGLNGKKTRMEDYHLDRSCSGCGTSLNMLYLNSRGIREYSQMLLGKTM